MGYDSMLDTNPELGPDTGSHYLMMIGILKWMIELGRIDIVNEVLLLLSHIALSREGHLEAAVHVIAMLVRCTIPD